MADRRGAHNKEKRLKNKERVAAYFKRYPYQTISMAASDLGLSRQTIHSILSELRQSEGLPRTQQEARTIQIKRWFEQHLGSNPSECARALGINRLTVVRHLRKIEQLAKGTASNEMD